MMRRLLIARRLSRPWRAPKPDRPRREAKHRALDLKNGPHAGSYLRS